MVRSTACTEREHRRDAEQIARLVRSQSEPGGFVRTFAAVAILHLAFAVGGARQFDDLAHAHRFASSGPKL